MDDPFASVDELTARQLRETTRRLCEQLHRTVLFVTHNLPEAAYMRDFVVALTARPACVEAYLVNPFPCPRQWGPQIYRLPRTWRLSLVRHMMRADDVHAIAVESFSSPVFGVLFIRFSHKTSARKVS